MTTLKGKKVLKAIDRRSKKGTGGKVRATRLRHKMESLYLEYLVDLSMEEKTIWVQKLEKEKEDTVLQWDRLKKKEKKCNKAAAPTVAMEKGAGESPTTKKKILMTLQQSMISTNEETKKKR
jgi:transcriptional regulator CtsR